MALIVQLMDDFHDLINKNGGDPHVKNVHKDVDDVPDPRTNHWPLMSSPFPTLAICLSYVYLTKFAGPKLMENRKPFELRNVLIAYNLFQVIFSSWLFYEVRSMLDKFRGIIIEHKCFPRSSSERRLF
uniref:Elongation of very long chain fatty acids protein n=1 Tax=Timema poppense TaxID=170557 RepID=A0A7R9CPE0_TIMPO|nr:unnamed protein product [Timema poppensis]